MSKPDKRKRPGEPYALIVDGKRTVSLADLPAEETDGLSKEEAGPLLDELGREFAELGNLLTFAGTNALLVILQGRDASGKDGTIRKILEYSNIQNAHVQSFKVPSGQERSHDFLWRIHQVAPARGHITLFNRSHYEDVIAVRVHDLAPKAVWRARFEHINNFERLLADEGTIILKFLLNVSAEEQYARLLEREKGPRTAWKLDPADWRELPLWDEVTRAYDDVLARCSSPELPWHVVPADKKWFRNLAVLERIVATLRPFRKDWLATLDEMGRRAISEIDEIRKRAGRADKAP